MSPRAGLPKRSSRFMFLSVFCFFSLFFFCFNSPPPPLSGLRGSRPQNGSMILYNRKKVKYRKDGYCWKKRKDGKTTREDHMKLKVQGVEVSLLVLGFRGLNGKGGVWGGGQGGNPHPDTDKHRSPSSPPVAVMETGACCSQPVSPRSLTKKQCSTTIVFPRKPVEWNRLFVPY